MKLTLAEPKYLKDSIAIISELVNEAKFKITPNAVELVAMDPANVAMVIFKLLSSAFIEYEVKQETELAIDLSNLKQILRRAGANDVLTLEVLENKLNITLKGKSTRTFSIPLLDVEDKEQTVPDLSFPASIDMKSSVLNDAIEDVAIVAESLSFQVNANNFVIEGESDLSKAKIDIPKDEETKIILEGMEQVKAKYSVEYLKKIMAAAKISEDVSIQFNNDYPLKLNYSVVDKLHLSFILAPRVEND